MTASERTARLVLRWCDHYVRGLPPSVAQERRDEIVSDLHEHAADGGSATSIARRWVFGMPSDLLWRREQVRRRSTLVPALPRGGWMTGAVALGALEIAWALVLLVRVATNAGVYVDRDAVWQLLAAAGLTALGLAMFVRGRTRPLGTALLSVTAILLVSATYNSLNAISWIWSGRYQRYVLRTIVQLPLPVALALVYLPALLAAAVFVTAAVRSRRPVSRA